MRSVHGYAYLPTAIAVLIKAGQLAAFRFGDRNGALLPSRHCDNRILGVGI